MSIAAGRRWGRNLAFLSFSFANTAGVTVFAQHQFWGRPQGAFWTALALLAGAVAALLGVAWAARRSGSVAAGCVLFGVLLMLAGAGLRWPPLAYAGVLAGLAFLSGALMQRFDQASVQLAGSGERLANDLSVSLLRFLGMWLAPAAFSVMAPGTGWAMGLLAALVLLVGVSAWRFRVDGGQLAPVAPQAAPDSRLASREWLLWAAGLMVYANYCVLASAAPFLLRDLLAQPSAMSHAWALIAGVYAAAMGANALVQWRRWAPRLAWLWVAPAVLTLVALGLYVPLAASVAVQAGGSAALGAAFGLFLMGYRDDLTRQAVQQQRPALLARYNQLPRWATLLAFAVLAGLATAAESLGWRLADGVALYLLASSAGVLLLAPWWARAA